MSYKKEKIYIYGAGDRGTELYENIQKFYVDTIDISGFIDKEKIGIKCGLPISRIDTIFKDSVIVISIFKFEVALQVALELKEQGFCNVYWYNANDYREERVNFWAEQCVDCCDWCEGTLRYVEMHAMDSCNLNCIGCTHFSPIFGDEELSLKNQLDTVLLLQQKVTSVARFCILGGEPFLNKEIQLYIEGVKKIFPKAHISIVTNGLLIPRLPEKLLQYISKENICISISEYEPTHRMINQIIEVLNKYNIIYNIREARKLFNKPLSLRPVEEVYCISDGCVIISDGKIARCPTLMYIEKLNEKFQTDFPTEGIYDLGGEMSPKELKRVLKEPISLCNHCVKNEIKWGTCGSSVSLEHFVKVED